MNGFRKSFGMVGRSMNWYPKHMNTGIKQMQAKLRSVDCILEIHDARVPLSGRNPNFSHLMVGDKPHIVILNKVDLITNKDKKKIHDIYNKSVTKNLIFTNCKSDQDQGIKKIIPMMRELIEKSERYHRTGVQEYNAMIIGIPNVGKTSFINIMRAKHLKKPRALKVAPSAGVTKSVHMKVRICPNPEIFLYDTPGILTPRVADPTTGIKLAVCGSFPDHDVGEMMIADYILFEMNRQQNFSYVKLFGLTEPCDCITTVLTIGALHLNIMNQVVSTTGEGFIKKPNFEQISKMFIAKFRSGSLGKMLLDDLDTFKDFKPCDEVELKENEIFQRSQNN